MRKRWLAVALLAGLSMGILGVALAAGSGHGQGGGQAQGNGKGHSGGGSGQGQEHGTHPHTPVLICHHTHSADNPVVPIVTDDDAVIAHHEQHADDQIFTANVPAPNDKASQLAMCGIESGGPGGSEDPGDAGGGSGPGSAASGNALPTPPPLTG